MPKRMNVLTSEQQKELRAQLFWTDEEFDLEVIDGPHSTNPEGRWRVRVVLGKRCVVLYEPAKGHIKLDARSAVVNGGRPSTKTSDINKAISRAEAFLLKLRARNLASDRVEEDGLGASPDDVSLGLIHDLFRVHRLGAFEDKFQQNLSLVMDLIETYCGRSTHPLQIDESWARGFIDWRMTQTIELVRTYPSGARDAATLAPVGGVTALNNLRDYDQVIQFAYEFRRGAGRQRLMESNPLREIRNWPRYEKALRERASDELYELLMTPLRLTGDTGVEVVLPAPVDAADPTGLGIVRTVVALKYHTARRREAVLNLRCGDVITSGSAIRRVLRKLGGAHRPDWAEVFVHGVLVFRAEFDKSSYGRVFPMSGVLRGHVDAHLARLAAAGYSTAHEAPLFPRPTAAGEPAAASTLYRIRSVRSWQLSSGEVRVRDRKGGWYTEALYIAREYLERQGLDPDAVVPTDPDDPTKILDGFKAHAWRGWWATKLERLGFGKNTSASDFDLDRHANFAGSWSILGEGIREERYVDLDPRVLLAIASFEDGTHFLRERAKFEEKRTSELLARVAAASPSPQPLGGERAG